MSRRDEVLQAALDLLDEVGLDALTTRRLAEKLGVQPGALYRHFPSKQALLVAMVEQVVGAAQVPEVAAGNWQGLLRVSAESTRSAMLTRRDGARLVITHVASSVDGQRLWHELIRRLGAAGLGAARVNTVLDTVFAYVNGFTIEEQSRDGFPQRPAQRARRDEAFAAGLELIIAGAGTVV